MTHDPRDQTDYGEGTYVHEPRATRRVAAEEQEQGFLERLQEQGVVVAVGDDGKPAAGGLPPETEWIVYPNGDLQRLQMR